MFKRNHQQKTKSKSTDKNERKVKKSEKVFFSESLSPIATRHYNDEFRNYNLLNRDEFKSKQQQDTIVLHRYELTYKEQEDSSSDPESYQKTTKYLAMNQFDRLVYKLSGNK